MKESKTVTVEPKNKFECGLGCAYLRRYESSRTAWYCSLFNDRFLYLEEKEIIHRAAKCVGSHLFTMRIPNDETSPPTFEE
jgi:hypothetical protein